MEKFIPDEARIQSVQDNYKKVLSNVQEAAIKAGRKPDDVRLMAVTKTVESARKTGDYSSWKTLLAREGGYDRDFIKKRSIYSG